MGVKVYKNTKNGLILYKNTKLEMEGNYNILGIKYNGKRITKMDSKNGFTFNLKGDSDFENSLKLVAKESLMNSKLKWKNRVEYKEPKMGKHKDFISLPCNGIGINFNGKFICSKCNLQTYYYASDVYGIST